MHPIDGPSRRLDRAAEHIQAFNDAVSLWNDSEPLRLVAKHFNADKTEYIYRFEFAAIPALIGIIAGDVLHNLRSALDNLTWQLALTTRSDPYARTAFPIYLVDNGNSRRNIRELLQDVPDGARKVIESLQPYSAPDGIKPEFHALWLLHELSDIDKHRFITVAGAGWGIAFKAGMGHQWLNEYTIEIHVPVVDKDFPPPPPKMSYQLTLGHKVFPSGSGISINALPAIHKFIAEVVLPRFVCFFPK